MGLLKCFAFAFILLFPALVSAAGPIFPNGDYYFTYRFLWGYPTRYLTGSVRETADNLGIVDVRFDPQKFDQIQRWRVRNNSDGTVYIQNVRTLRYLGLGGNCTAPAESICVNSLHDTTAKGERWKFVESSGQSGRYYIQLARSYKTLYQPIIGPLGPSHRPLEIAVLNSKLGNSFMSFQIVKG
ncbi:hypothetical protein TWF481_006090 [Arthrobotrys musiformis]|uniref:Ricin B lectin domain-containing protein n=1 Tax=Arthrobotrys musiformis TaxID=47236 RepID=A0AAV9WHC3_9PEZI